MSRRKSHASTGNRRWSPVKIVLVLGGLVLVAAFVVRIGAREIGAQLLRAGPRALWLLVPYGVGTAIGAFPWASLLPREMRPSPLAVLESRFAASGANALLPFFGLAGEPSRLLWLPSTAQARGVAAIVVDRVLYNAANGLLLLAGALAALGTPLARPLVSLALVIAVLTLAVTAAGFWLVSRFGVGNRIQSLLRWLLGKSYGDADFGGQVDRALLDLVGGPISTLLRGAGVHLLGKAAMGFEVYVGLWALGASAGPVETLILAVVPIALSFFFSSVPSQIGLQEGAQTLVASSLGLDPAAVLSLVLLQRLRQLAFASLLPLLLAAARPARPAPPSPPRQQEC